jgi:hypothetical protein
MAKRAKCPDPIANAPVKERTPYTHVVAGLTLYRADAASLILAVAERRNIVSLSSCGRSSLLPNWTVFLAVDGVMTGAWRFKCGASTL